jgi:hypothetical protein
MLDELVDLRFLRLSKATSFSLLWRERERGGLSKRTGKLESNLPKDENAGIFGYFLQDFDVKLQFRDYCRAPRSLPFAMYFDQGIWVCLHTYISRALLDEMLNRRQRQPASPTPRV